MLKRHLMTLRTKSLNASKELTEKRIYAFSAIKALVEEVWGGTIELFLVPASAPRLV